MAGLVPVNPEHPEYGAELKIEVFLDLSRQAPF